MGQKKYKTMSVDRETVVEKWGLPYLDNQEEGVHILEDAITSTGRWSVYHDLLVHIKDKVYKTHYSEGATEQQDERPWEYDETVEFLEMRAVEKVVTVWEPVEEAA